MYMKGAVGCVALISTVPASPSTIMAAPIPARVPGFHIGNAGALIRLDVFLDPLWVPQIMGWIVLKTKPPSWWPSPWINRRCWLLKAVREFRIYRHSYVYYCRCDDSQKLWPVLKKVQEHYGDDALHLALHLYPLAYHRNAFLVCQSAYAIRYLTKPAKWVAND